MRFVLAAVAAVAVFQGCGEEKPTTPEPKNNVQVVKTSPYKAEFDNDFNKFLAALGSAGKVNLKSMNVQLFETNRETYGCVQTHLKTGQAYAQKLWDGENADEFTANQEVQKCLKKPEPKKDDPATLKAVQDAKAESDKKVKEQEAEIAKLRGSQKTEEDIKILDKHAEAEKQKAEIVKAISIASDPFHMAKLHNLDPVLFPWTKAEVLAKQLDLCNIVKSDILVTADRQAACQALVSEYDFILTEDGTPKMIIKGDMCDTVVYMYPFKLMSKEFEIRKYACLEAQIGLAVRNAEIQFNAKSKEVEQLRDRIQKQEDAINAMGVAPKATTTILDRMKANLVTLEGITAKWGDILTEQQAKLADNAALLAAARMA